MRWGSSTVATAVVDLRGLEELVALETLDVTNVHTGALPILRQCPRLITLLANEDITALESIIHALRHSPSLQVLDISFTTLTAAGMTGLDEIGTLQCLTAHARARLDASTLSRCRSLRELDLRSSVVTDALVSALADVRTLETLKLTFCGKVRDVSALARSVSLHSLDLGGTAVCDTGIAELERIPSLTSLSLACRFIMTASTPFRSKSLRRLVLSQSSVTDAGLVGLELAPALE
jgi:hypothetical protein